MMLPCNIVRDLLPSYLEQLTSPETEKSVAEHLESCPSCREAKEAMEAEVTLDTRPAAKLDFFKKLRRKQIIGAALTVLITLFCLYGLYSQEFYVDASSTAALEAAIDEHATHFAVEADVLESKKVGGRIFVLYEDLNARLIGTDGEPVEAYRRYGVLLLQPGLFGRYHIEKSIVINWPLYFYQKYEFGGKAYLVVSGVNELPGVASYRIFDDTEAGSGELIHEGTASAPLLEIVPVPRDQPFGSYVMGAVYLDENGNEVDKSALLDHFDMDGGGGGGGAGSLGTMLFFMAIVLLLGIVFVRYFLTP